MLSLPGDDTAKPVQFKIMSGEVSAISVLTISADVGSLRLPTKIGYGLRPFACRLSISASMGARSEVCTNAR